MASFSEPKINTAIRTPYGAKDAGFATFNDGDHLCVEIPDKSFTITAKTSEGKKITFAFGQYEENGPPKCVDIQHHTSGAFKENGERQIPIQEGICFTTGQDTFIFKKDDPKPTTLVVIFLQ